ncbi:MAG: hypothetical protein P4L27_11140 [Ignavibacteriaceae bacterium]|nr:hypothetical protein [Ignavibacteriaceae bacterium]
MSLRRCDLKEEADLAEYRNRDKQKLHESILRTEEQGKNGGDVFQQLDLLNIDTSIGIFRYNYFTITE